MKKTTKGVLAGAAGLGLVLGGATFALWTDSAPMDTRDSIAAGNLDVAVWADSWYDVSPDRTDKPHKINIHEFKIIPQDEIQRDYKVKVALEGDNMVAQLRLTNDGKPLRGDLAEGLQVSYDLLDADGNLISTDIDDDVFVALGAADNSNIATTTIPVDGHLGRGADFTVRVTVKFQDVDEQDLVRTHARLANADLELKQVRHGEAGFNE